MTTPIPPWLVWLDTETSGLDPDRDDIIEVGVVLTGHDLVEVAAVSWLVVPDWVMADELAVPGSWLPDGVVREMHTASGLAADLAALRYDHAPDIGDVEHYLLTFLDQHCGTDEIALAGTGVAEFDRLFLARDMPTFTARFHYRSIDVGNVRRLAQLAGVPYEAPKPHRALGDARAALDEARHWRDVLRGVIPQAVHDGLFEAYEALDKVMDVTESNRIGEVERRRAERRAAADG